MEVDAERARQLSLFRPLGTVPTTPPDEPLTPVAGAPWRDDWMWILTGVVGYQRNSCGYCKSDDGSELHLRSFVISLTRRRCILLLQLPGRAAPAL